MNVKAGDLAILIRSSSGKNLGHICEVKEFVGTIEYPDMTLHDAWRVEFMNPIEVEILGSDGNMYQFVQNNAVACDSWLRALPGLNDEDINVTDKELEIA